MLQLKYIYSGSANIIQRCNVAFYTNDCWNFPKMVPVFGIESMVTRDGLRYTWDNLTPVICSLIKPAAMEKNAISRQNPHGHVIIST